MLKDMASRLGAYFHTDPMNSAPERVELTSVDLWAIDKAGSALRCLR